MSKAARANIDLLRGGIDLALVSERDAAKPDLVVVGAYERISDDQESENTGDRGAGVRRQQAANRDLASAVGWKIARHYVDNDVSAFKDVVRPAFEQLLLDLAEGSIDGIIVYDLDRLARRGDDLERVIKLYDAGRADRRPMYFRSAHDAIDLSSPDGITLARVMIAFANKASRDTSRRVAAQRRSIALAGDPVGGTRPFGWNWVRAAVPLPDGSSGKGKRRHVVNDSEAAEIRRIANEMLSGAGINSIVRDINARGVRTPRGNQWKAQTLKQMLLSPRLAGYRIHQGRVLINSETKEWVKGNWRPILDQQTWMAIAERLTVPNAALERRAEPHRRYLLSGILRCAECSGPLHGNSRKDGYWYYGCKVRGGVGGQVGCARVSASGQALDHLFSRIMKERIRTTDVAYAAASSWDGATELETAKAKIAGLLDEFNKADREGADALLSEIRRLSEQAENLRVARTAWLAQQGAKRVRKRISSSVWDELTLEDRRRYISTEIEAIFVRRATKRGNRFDPDRLVIVWRET